MGQRVVLKTMANTLDYSELEGESLKNFEQSNFYLRFKTLLLQVERLLEDDDINPDKRQ